MSERKFKVVLLGEGRVGKTSLVLRYTRNLFDDQQQSTIQASYQTKRLNIDGQSVNLSIWDTAGQERFHALGPIYYRDSNGALLVYDITDNDSFVRVQNWVKELRKMLGKDVELVIAGNKCDMERNRAVKNEDAEAYAKSVGAKHFITSAKLGKNVNEIFLHLSKKMLSRKPVAKSGGGGGAPGGGAFTWEDDSAAQNTKGGCCK